MGGHRRAEAIVGAIVTAVLAITGTMSLLVGGEARGAATSNGVPRPKQGLYFGTWAKPFGSESKQQALMDMESRIGRRFALDHQYYRWNSAIPTSHETWTRNQGRIPFISWHSRRSDGAGPSWAAIASGQEDAWIASRADALRAFGTPVYLTFHHEPEDDAGAKGTPAQFAAAFRHVVDVFRDRGATNVSFVWTMMAWSFDSSEAASFYPGDGYVDVVGADGYNWFPGRQGADWRSFRDVMAKSRAFAVAHGKTFMVAEFGVQEDPKDPGHKGQWYRDMIATAESWPELIALAYFDSDKIYGWMPDTSANSLSGFRTLANSAVASPMLGSTPAPPPPPPSPSPSPSPSPPRPSPSPSSPPRPSSPPPTTAPPTTAPPTTAPPTTAPPTTAPPTTAPPTTAPPTTAPPTTAPPTTAPPTTPPPSDPPGGGGQPRPGKRDGLRNHMSQRRGAAVTPRASGLGTQDPFREVSTWRGSIRYDRRHAINGSAVRHSVDAKGHSFYRWNVPVREDASWYGRVYVWLGERPEGRTRIVRAMKGGHLGMAVDIMRDGRLRLVDGTGETVVATPTKMEMRRWVRIEWAVSHLAGTAQLRLYNRLGSTVATNDVASDAGNLFGRRVDTVQLGRMGRRGGRTVFWTDEPGISLRGYLGPV